MQFPQKIKYWLGEKTDTVQQGLSEGGCGAYSSQAQVEGLEGLSGGAPHFLFREIS